MESLYKLAVEGIFNKDFSCEEFKKLPPEIQCDLIPFVLEKLKQINTLIDKNKELNREVQRLNQHVEMLMDENLRLHKLITSIKSNQNNPDIFPNPKFPFMHHY